MVKRLLALLGAVALVAGAIVLRGALDDGGETVDAGDGQGTTGDGGGDDAGDPLVVACIPELRNACEELVRADELRVEDPADTIAALAGGEAIDAWVTLDPWPAIATFDAPDASLLSSETVAMATSPLVAVVRPGALDGACATTPDWACIAEQEGDAAAVPSVRSASGTVLLGWAAAGWSAATRPGEPFARQEIEGLPEFGLWLASLTIDLSDPLADVVIGLPDPSVVAAIGADAEDRLLGTARGADYTASPTAAPATVAVVVIGPGAQRVAGEPTFAVGLADLGWTTTDDPATRSTGLPAPGVLYALAQEVG